MSSRHARALIVASWALVAGILGTGHAAADPELPPAPPVIGPLQYGPPAYPRGAGLPLLPRARSGVAADADSLSPTPPPPTPNTGIAGVDITADTVAPIPLPANTAPAG